MTGPQRLHGDAGQVTGMVVILTVALLALAGLVLDGGRLLTARREARAVATAAARAGTQAVDEDAVRRSVTRLDRAQARRRAEAFLTTAGFEGSAVATDVEVTVTVHTTSRPVLLSLIGLGDRPIVTEGSARIERGR